MSPSLLADEIQFGLIEQDAIQMIPSLIHSLGRSVWGLILCMSCLFGLFLFYRYLKDNDLYGPILKQLSFLLVPSGILLYGAGFYSIHKGVETGLVQELVELESDFKEVHRLSDQLEEGFSLELKQFVEKGKAELLLIPSDARDELSQWFRRWSDTSQVKAVLSNGSQLINLTSELLHENSLMLLPTLQSIVRLKVREAQEDSSNSVYQTLSMAKDMLRDSFHGIQFLDLFLNNPNRLFNASSLRLFESSKDVKAFWTYIDLEKNGFWFMIGLVTEEKTDLSVKLQLKKFAERAKQRPYRLPAQTYLLNLNDKKNQVFKSLPDKFVCLGRSGLRVYGIKPIAGLLEKTHLLMEISADGLLQKQIESENTLYLIGLALIIAPLPMSLLMGYSLGKPLRHIHKAIDELIEDKQPIPLTRTGRDQVSEIAQLFNQFLIERAESLATEQFHSKTMLEINSWWNLHKEPNNQTLKKILAHQHQYLDATEVSGNMLDHAPEILCQIPDAAILHLNHKTLIFTSNNQIVLELPPAFETRAVTVRLLPPRPGFPPHIAEVKP